MDLEGLDKLSNAELRLMCIQHGLPNVPVTDSSRKLLLKRLRETLINNASKETAATKSSNRRETMHASKTTVVETVGEPATAPSGGKSRRTIAAATAAASAPVINKDDASAPTSIPVSTRRRSVQREVVEPVKPSKSAAVKHMPTIVIEDDEEDDDLLTAVENAEKNSTTSSVPIETIPARRKSRSASVPKAPLVTEVTTIPKKRAMTPLVEDFQEVTSTEIRKQMHVIKEKSAGVEAKPLGFSATTKVSTKPMPMPTPTSQTTFTQPMAKSITKEYSQSRYNYQSSTPSVYSTPSMRYSVGPGTTYDSAYRSKYMASNLLNEQSDTDGNDEPKSPFLSNFARNLERSRSVGRSTSGGDGNSGRYVRRSGSNYESSIHGRRASQNDATLGQLIHGLNRKYHLKTIMIVLGVLCVSIFAYIAFNRPVTM